MIAAIAAAAIILTTHHQPVANRSEWLAIARCESGAKWDDTQGFYDGGLQFSPTTWTSMDTEHFALRANQATRRQQMIVANRTLKAQGWNAWPECSRELGLS